MKLRARRPSHERRPQIAAAALRLIGERGLPALTSAALAAEVGLTSGALFRHFPSLDGILEEAVESATQRLAATFPSPSLPARDRLFALLHSRVELLSGDPGLGWLLRSDQAYFALPPAAVARLGDLVERSRAFLLAALREGAAAGTIRSDVEPEALLVLVTGAVHALVGQQGVHRNAAPPDAQRRARLLRALETLLSPPPLAAATGPIPSSP
jgi:AcrR family transcriptional regulator